MYLEKQNVLYSNRANRPGLVMCAGSGNGMAKSLLHAASEKYSVSNAVFAIIKGYFSYFFPPYHAQNHMRHGDF